MEKSLGRRIHKGFTLIELLVVIAIIAILAAILFPVFATARSKARDIATLSNLKQVAIGALQYQQDADGSSIPYQVWGSPWTAWGVLMQPYLKSTSVLFDAQRSVPWVQIDPDNQWAWSTTISINGPSYSSEWGDINNKDFVIFPDQQASPSTRAAFVAGGDPSGPQPYQWAKGMSQMHYFDGQRSSCPDINNYKDPSDWAFQYNRVYEGAVDYHHGMLPVAFADGHVKAVNIHNYIGGDTVTGACESEYYGPGDLPNTTKGGKMQEFWGRWWERSSF